MDIEDLISTRRLLKYQGVKETAAVDGHLFNTELCETFYPSLCALEIVLRNKIDFILSKHFGNSWIFKPKYYLSRNKAKMAKAIRALIRNRQDKKNKNNLVAELSFGFWTFLFTPHYKNIWNKGGLLQELFEYKKETIVLSKICAELNTIRHYRNKIFHYGAILNSRKNPNCIMVHNLIRKYLKDLSGKTIINQLNKIDRFNEILNSGIDKGIIKRDGRTLLYTL